MTEQTNPKKRRKYDADFKAEILKMVANGKPVSEVSQALGIGENIIYRWKSKGRQSGSIGAKGGKQVAIMPGKRMRATSRLRQSTRK